MLTECIEKAARRQPTTARSDDLHSTLDIARHTISASTVTRRLKRTLRVEWLAQTVASLCWIASVLTYGIGSAGDCLQLVAASAWLMANVATIFAAEAD